MSVASKPQDIESPLLPHKNRTVLTIKDYGELWQQSGWSIPVFLDLEESAAHNADKTAVR